MGEKVVKAKLFSYHVEAPSPYAPGESVLVEKTALRGQKLDEGDLSEYDLKRGEDNGAFYSDEELEAQAAAVPEPEEGEGDPMTDLIPDEEVPKEVPQPADQRPAEELEEGGEELGLGEELGPTDEVAEEEEEEPSSPGGSEATAESGPAFDEMSEDELALYLEEARPTVAATVALAGNDPDLARRLIAAEQMASIGPRSGVISKLQRVASR